MIELNDVKRLEDRINEIKIIIDLMMEADLKGELDDEEYDELEMFKVSLKLMETEKENNVKNI
jgi:hypothetical protein